MDTPKERPPVIPTRFKAALRKGWAYPVGAELIARSLLDCPRKDVLELSFWLLRRAAHKPELDGPALVLSASYRERLVRPIFLPKDGDSKWAQPGWKLTVLAVPSSTSHRIRELLVAEGLPRVAAWLSAPRTQTWLAQRQRLEFTYDPETDGLRCQEKTGFDRSAV